MSNLMEKCLWSKLRSSAFGKKSGRRQGEDMNSLVGKANVNEEYKEAFRTKSYLEMCNKVQGQLEITMNIDEARSSSSSTSSASSSSSSSSTKQNVRSSKSLLEPRQETLISVTNGSPHHQSLGNYFEISLEAYKICESLLKEVHQVRINHLLIKNVTEFIEQVPDISSWNPNQNHRIHNNLMKFSLRANPFSSGCVEKFHKLHDTHVLLFRELTSQCRTKKRRIRYIRYIKRAIMTTFAGLGCGALAIGLLVLGLYTMAGGIVSTLGLTVCTLGVFIIKKVIGAQEKLRNSAVESEQLDVAARGVYVLINDFDTISRLVHRLKDEIEHQKYVADICFRKWKSETMKEVVKEFQIHEPCFVEQLQELEKHIYLCFLDISRSRRLVMQEMAK